MCLLKRITAAVIHSVGELGKTPNMLRATCNQARPKQIHVSCVITNLSPTCRAPQGHDREETHFWFFFPSSGNRMSIMSTCTVAGRILADLRLPEVEKNTQMYPKIAWEILRK